ncbi:MAG: cellulase family glycosylhydrolase, partial [Opitutaceae bacterium]|nr:cellulase family glycosylhydrolase [Cytophagales bacterium]
MKKLLLTINLLFFIGQLSFAQTPLSLNGRLKLVGNQLSNQCGSPVQLRGMSTHSALTYKNCLTEAGISSLATAGSDLIRLAIYPEPTGTAPNNTPAYQADSVANNAYILSIVNLAEKYGMYVIVDWHVLSDQTPTKNQPAAEK